MKREIIMVGPPASGKGTQTEKLKKLTGLVHADTGAMLRAAVKSGTEEGIIAGRCMDNGQLVPIETVGKIIKKRLSEDDCKDGFILDGYPRSIEQAQKLEDILKEVNEGRDDVKFTVAYFDIPSDILLERIVNRVSCPKCGAIYNLKTMTLKEAGKCDECGTKLVKRSDDTEEVAQKRFSTYFEQTEPVLKFYEDRGTLVKIDAKGSIDEVFEHFKKAVL